MDEGHEYRTQTSRMRGSPYVLRDYALLADGERGALVDPRGKMVWMCAPRWQDDAVFSALIGGAGHFTITPQDRWNVWGGSYEDGTLIFVSRWVLADAVIECREAMALPAETSRAVVLRQIRAVKGEAQLRILLDVRAGFGEHSMNEARRENGHWLARSGGLHVRLTGAPGAAFDGCGVLSAPLILSEGQRHDLVLEVATQPLRETADPTRLWSATERAWAKAIPSCTDLPASRDARHAYAVLHGLTSSSGGIVAAATTSLPEHADTGSSYDYRYVWIRDQCFAGSAYAAHGARDQLDGALRFVTARILQDGDALRPAYTVTGASVPDQRELNLPGYPGGNDKVGNKAGRQFQLDVFGEALSLFAAAARLDCLDAEAVRAAHVAAEALARHWNEPDAGMWELEERWWTESRLSAAVGLRAAAACVPGTDTAAWERLAATILARTRRRCRSRDGYWQRATDDPGLDAAVLRPMARDPRSCGLRTVTATRRAIQRELTEDGYVYRFRHDDHPLGQEEGSFLLCGFLMAQVCQAEGRHAAAVHWFERARSACGPPGLLAEEYDTSQRQLRGNLPQAFVHAALLETAARFTAGGDQTD